MIEPSHEFGYRDLETVLELRQQGSAVPSAVAEAKKRLRIPYQLLQQRNANPNEDLTKKLDLIASLIAEGKITEASALLP